jgi:hypothetical protein
MKIDQVLLFFAGGVCGGRVVIPTQLDSGILFTKSNSLSVDGQETGRMIVDLNYPDVVVPVCDPKSTSPSGKCFDPKKSNSFRYCDNGRAQCFDRMEPKMQCYRSVPAAKWSLETSTFTEHHLSISGAVTAFHSFEFEASLGANNKQNSVVPIKGSLSVKDPILGLGPARISCRNETFVSRSGAQFIEIGKDSIVLSESVPLDAESSEWTESYHMVPVNASWVLGKYAFNMFSPTVCEANVLGHNVSSHWTAVVDLTQECLIVPQFMLENIQAWQGGDKRIEFTLSNPSGDEIGQRTSRVVVPLDGVCVKSFPAKPTDGEFELTSMRPIVLGTSVIMSLAGADGAIGFETQAPYRIRMPVVAGSKHTPPCTVPRPTCIGNQYYYEARNDCVDPDCDAFFFSELDFNTRECVWKPIVPYLMYSALIGYVLIEMFAYRLKQRATQLAQSACERNMNVNS